jgi:hypothetical protein
MGQKPKIVLDLGQKKYFSIISNIYETNQYH